MFREMNIEEAINSLTQQFVKVVERNMCESVAYGILGLLEEDIVIGCVYTDGSYDRLYSMANFLKGRTDELPLALKDWLLREFGSFISDWEFRARQCKTNEEDNYRESQWEAQ